MAKLTDIKQYKALVGKVIHLDPTGNSRRRNQGGRDQSTTAEVVKVGRAFVTIRVDGSGRDEQFRVTPSGLKNDHQYGYEAFETRKDLKDEVFGKALQFKMSEALRAGFGSREFAYDDLKKAAAILGIDWQEPEGDAE